jgi:hypothetical protein
LDAGFKAICTRPGKARRRERADFVILEGLAPAKRPLIDIAMSANAAPTMSGMFGNVAKGIAEVRKDGKLNLPLEMVLSP